MKVGDKVVCVSGGWVHLLNGGRFDGPRTHDILTIERVETHGGRDYLGFIEWPANNIGSHPVYAAIYFRPVDYSFGEQVAEELEKEIIQEPVTV